MSYFRSGSRRAERVSELAEQLPMSQSEVVLGFRTGLPRQRRARTALRVMTALLGGSTGSRLLPMYGKGWLLLLLRRASQPAYRHTAY